MSIKIWHGQWSDGKTAATHDVEIKLTSRGLEITPVEPNANIPTLWPFKSLTSPDPIKTNNRSVQLTSEQNPEQRLFIHEPRFATSILTQAPQLGAAAHQWHLLKWPLGIAAGLVLFWALTYFDIISPADRIAHHIPDNVRHSIGDNVITYLTKGKKICSSPEGDKAFTKMINRLKAGVKDTDQYDIRIADMNIVNAFAAPGEKIIVSGKLIQQAKSPEEVIGVIAHEIGHGIERHPEAGIVRAFGLMTIMQLMTAGEAGTLSEIALFLAQSSYSRGAEREADDHAARILQKINVDTKPLAGFFKRLMKKEETELTDIAGSKKPNTTEKSAKTNSKDKTITKEDDSSWFDLISTHPPSRERIEFFNKNARPTTPPIMSDIEWKALQNICGKKEKNKKLNKK